MLKISPLNLLYILIVIYAFKLFSYKNLSDARFIPTHDKHSFSRKKSNLNALVTKKFKLKVLLPKSYQINIFKGINLN